MFNPTAHAVTRYIERFEGNLNWERAVQRLTTLARKARFRRTLPGGARLYAIGAVNLVVAEGTILTVFRLTYTDAPLAA